jgi:cytidylate kinase
LPRERLLSVRIVGRNADRIAFLGQIERLTPQEAERHMIETDSQRKKFMRDYFRRDSADPHEYDIVLDSTALGEECCADLIVRALHGKELLARNRQSAKTRPTPVPAE